MFETGELDKLSDNEVRERMKIWFAHQKGKEKINLEAAVDEFIQQQNILSGESETSQSKEDTFKNLPGSSGNTAEQNE